MGILEHIANVTYLKKPWSEYTEADKKSLSIFMLNKWLSMNFDLVEFINALQRFTTGQLQTAEAYKLLQDILPKSKIYLKYVKGKKDDTYNKDLIEYIAKYYEVSKLEAVSYLDIFNHTLEGSQQIVTILEKYGLEEKKINKLIK